MSGPVYRGIPIFAQNLTSVQKSTDGPFVPFIIEGSTTLLYEAKIGGDDAEYIYFSPTFFGKQINCKYS